MAESPQAWKKTARKETGLFLGLLLIGFLVLPALIFLVGDAVFGEYGGSGFGAFYGALLGHLADGNTAAWFVVLSPYLVWQLLRLTLAAFRAGAH
jgi:hypothetical protein